MPCRDGRKGGGSESDSLTNCTTNCGLLNPPRTPLACAACPWSAPALGEGALCGQPAVVEGGGPQAGAAAAARKRHPNPCIHAAPCTLLSSILVHTLLCAHRQAAHGGIVLHHTHPSSCRRTPGGSGTASICPLTHHPTPPCLPPTAGGDRHREERHRPEHEEHRPVPHFRPRPQEEVSQGGRCRAFRII